MNLGMGLLLSFEDYLNQSQSANSTDFEMFCTGQEMLPVKYQNTDAQDGRIFDKMAKNPSILAICVLNNLGGISYILSQQEESDRSNVIALAHANFEGHNINTAGAHILCREHSVIPRKALIPSLVRLPSQLGERPGMRALLNLYLSCRQTTPTPVTAAKYPVAAAR